MDRAIIRLAAWRQPKPGKFPARCEEAVKVLQHPDFFCDSIQVPKNVKWTSKTDFHFPSQVDSPWPETKMVHGKLFRSGEDWTTKPTVILVHGWNDDLGYVFRHPYLARQFARAGVNTAMIELPYHLHRRPTGANAVNDFLSEDLFCTMLAAHQSIADIRALLAWLEAEGCAQLGLWGVSLGGWLSGLVSCHDARVRFAVLQIPAARMDRVIAELEFCAPIRRSLQGACIDFGNVSLRAQRTKLPVENILVIEAEDDLFIKKEAIEEFWEAWGRPEIWRLRHSHISILFSLKTLRRGAAWVTKKTANLPSR